GAGCADVSGRAFAGLATPAGEEALEVGAGDGIERAPLGFEGRDGGRGLGAAFARAAQRAEVGVEVGRRLLVAAAVEEVRDVLHAAAATCVLEVDRRDARGGVAR